MGKTFPPDRERVNFPPILSLILSPRPISPRVYNVHDELKYQIQFRIERDLSAVRPDFVLREEREFPPRRRIYPRLFSSFFYHLRKMLAKRGDLHKLKSVKRKSFHSHESKRHGVKRIKKLRHGRLDNKR